MRYYSRLDHIPSLDLNLEFQAGSFIIITWRSIFRNFEGKVDVMLSTRLLIGLVERSQVLAMPENSAILKEFEPILGFFR